MIFSLGLGVCVGFCRRVIFEHEYRIYEHQLPGNEYFSLVNSVAFSHDGKRVAIWIGGNFKNALEVFNLENKSWEFIYNYESPVRSIAFSPDGQLIATGSNDKMLRIFDLSNKKVLFEYEHEV